MAAGISGYFFQLKGLLQLLADLNPIELLWHDLKRAIHTRHPKNTAELELFVKRNCGNILSTVLEISSPITGVLGGYCCQRCVKLLSHPTVRFNSDQITIYIYIHIYI